jgi:hypothetical protein
LDPLESESNERDEQFDDFPAISPGLIAALEKRMPERWPNITMPDRDIWYRAGQLNILELLRFVEGKQHDAPRNYPLT